MESTRDTQLPLRGDALGLGFARGAFGDGDASSGGLCGRSRVLVFTDYYLPGYKAGGPIRSVGAIVEMLGDEFEFYVVTGARDLGESRPYEGIAVSRWLPVGKAQVMYLDSGRPGWRVIRELLSEEWSLIYANSFFSPTTIRMLLLWRLMGKRSNVLLAPRGEFSRGALALKRLKKRAFIEVAKATGLYTGVYWHVSTGMERDELCDCLPAVQSEGGANRVFVAGNLSTIASSPDDVPFRDKSSGSIRIAFLSRVARKKNLLYAIDVVSRAKTDVVFDIWGPLEDSGYWRECEDLIARAPGNVKISYRGAVCGTAVVATLSSYHLFFFPTLGENFGHVILEAFAAGCPVLISAATPWSGLEGKGVGWDLPLSDRDAFLRAVDTAASWDKEDFERVATACRNLALDYLERSENISANREMFARVCSGDKVS